MLLHRSRPVWFCKLDGRRRKSPVKISQRVDRPLYPWPLGFSTGRTLFGLYAPLNRSLLPTTINSAEG